MFKVKATVIGFIGNVDKYPCHFQYKIGDEIIFDCESCHGRVCPDIWQTLMERVSHIRIMGPRYIESSYWYPIWYSTLSRREPKMKKFDGIGYANVFESY